MKVIELKEKESKFLINVLEKGSTWNREFIIYQWYEKSEGNYESKYKLIIDLLSLEQKFVKVEKTRTGEMTSDKRVTYFSSTDFKNIELIGMPFIMKRRSIQGNDIHLDKFIYSNKACNYLLEVENEDVEVQQLNGIEIVQNVSTNKSYLNIQMAIPFQTTHKEELNFLFKALSI